MTHWEIVRLSCYVLSAPALLYLALHHAHARQFAYALFYGVLAMLFAWYVLEITIASTGINTREYRVIGTPMVMAITAALLAITVDVWRGERSRRAGAHGRD